MVNFNMSRITAAFGLKNGKKPDFKAGDTVLLKRPKHDENRDKLYIIKCVDDKNRLTLKDFHTHKVLNTTYNPNRFRLATPQEEEREQGRPANEVYSNDLYVKILTPDIFENSSFGEIANEFTRPQQTRIYIIVNRANGLIAIKDIKTGERFKAKNAKATDMTPATATEAEYYIRTGSYIISEP